jgi:TonB family protein
MLRTAVLLLLSLTSAALYAQAPLLRELPPPREEVRRDSQRLIYEVVRFKLSVGPDGRIRDLEPLPHQNREMVNAVLPRVIGWQFSTAMRDGQPVSADTTLYVRLEATPQGDGQYSMRIVSAGVGPRASTKVVPRYPDSALRAGRTGHVMVEALVNAEGRVEQATAVAQYSDRPFVNAALQAARKWRFEPERLDGQPMAAKVTIPFAFLLPGVPEPRAPWAEARPDVQSEPAAADSPVRLLTSPFENR